WPLWQDGRMRPDGAAETALYESTGMKAMPRSAGMEIFYRAVMSNQPLVMAAYGDQEKLRKIFLPGQKVPSSETLPAPALFSGPDEESLREKTLIRLRQLFAEVIGLHPDRADVQKSMEDFGVDSIVVTRLNQKLTRAFRKFPKTLFFEYPTLALLTDYFVATFPEECATW